MGQLRCSRQFLGALLLLSCLSVRVEWIITAVATADIAGVDSSSKSRSGNSVDFVQFVKSRGIGKVRLYDADSTMLRALGGGDHSKVASPIEVIAGVQNEEIVGIGASLDLARSWVARNVLPYYPVTNIVAIAVGSQLGSSVREERPIQSMLPAMRNIRVALLELGLQKKIKVTSPQSLHVLSSYSPPSSAAFDQSLLLSGGALAPILDFLDATGSFFMLDLHENTLETQGVDAIPKPLHEARTMPQYNSLRDVVSEGLVAALSSAQHPRLRVVVTEAGPVRSGPAIAYSTNFVSVLNQGVSQPAEIDREGTKFSLGKGYGRSSSLGTLSARRLFVKAPSPVGPDVKARRKLANKSWCVAKSGQSTDALQSALDWACGAGGADCSAIQLGQSCYLPNDIQAHASYAFNNYYQKRNWASDSCDFNGLATVTSTDPSSASCLYSSNTNANGGPSTPTGTIVPNPGSYAPSHPWNRNYLILTSFALAFLLKRAFWSSEF